MRKYLLFLLFISNGLFAQEKNYKFDLDVDYGLGFYDSYDNIGRTKRSALFNASAKIFQLNAGYEIKDQIYCGLELRTRNFFASGDSSTIDVYAQSNALLFNTDFAFVKDAKKTGYIGFGFGVAGLYYSRMSIDSNQVEKKVELNAAGPVINLRGGYRFYFSKHFGLNFILNYSIYPMRVTEFRIDDIAQEKMAYRDFNDVIYNFRGFEGKVGLSVRF